VTAIAAAVGALDGVDEAHAYGRLDEDAMGKVVVLVDVDDMIRITDHGDEQWTLDARGELLVLHRRDEDSSRLDAMAVAHDIARQSHWNSWGLPQQGAQVSDIARADRKRWGDAWDQVAISFSQRVRLWVRDAEAPLPDGTTHARGSVGGDPAHPADPEPSDYEDVSTP
jgi:hypothetical protein